MRILVTGAGGFIGGHLVKRLLSMGHYVRAVDKKPFCDWWQVHEQAQNRVIDLRHPFGVMRAFLDGERIFDEKDFDGIEWVFHLAANMGGMLTITTKDAEIIRDNTLININMIEGAKEYGVKRFLFSSSACVYPTTLQEKESIPLKESDVYPAFPQHSYGWEKLHMEHLCKYYREEGWLDTRVVRFHNTYGPFGAWNDGREKAPAALCRKVAQAKLSQRCGCNPAQNSIEVWGDGSAVRTYMYIDDCVEGLVRLMESDHHEPLNLGRDRTVSVDELAIEIAHIAGFAVDLDHVDGPVGVQWRNSDNTLCKEVLGWEPSIPIEEGLIATYEWIEGLVEAAGCQGNCQIEAGELDL